MPSSSNPPGVNLASTRDEFMNFFFSKKAHRQESYYHPMYVYSQDADAVADRILQGASKVLGVQPVVGPSFPRGEFDRALKGIRSMASMASRSTFVDGSSENVPPVASESHESGLTDASIMPEVATSTTEPRLPRSQRNPRRLAAGVNSTVDRDAVKGEGADGKPRRRRGPKDLEFASAPAKDNAANAAATTVITAGKKDPLVVTAKDSATSHGAANGHGRRRGNRHNASGDFAAHGGDEFADSDFSGLNFNDPPPVVVSELVNGHGVTVVGTRLPSGELTTRMRYDRQLMLALSHSPFSLAHPDGYIDVANEMEEIVPCYPRRYIPREYCSPVEASPNTSSL